MLLSVPGQECACGLQTSSGDTEGEHHALLSMVSKRSLTVSHSKMEGSSQVFESSLGTGDGRETLRGIKSSLGHWTTPPTVQIPANQCGHAHLPVTYV